jgi:hypothetical protein
MENPKSNKEYVTDQPDAGPLDVGDRLSREETQQDATRRWRNEGIDMQVAVFRDRARGEYLDEHPGCKKRDAHEDAWRRALAEFPPPDGAAKPVDPEPVAVVEPEPVPADSGVSGLGAIPEDWPDLPSNASLQVEIAWCQASRLDVVEEGLNGSTVVDLALADSPAPSKAAIGWLETSIRAYSKYCDIAAKATATAEHEQEAVRRERLALADVLVLIGGEA